MNNKGVSEIVSQILLMLVTVVVVGIIIAAIVPQMSRGKSQIKFEESKLLRDNLFYSIQEVYNSPIGHTKEISLKLENLSLNIDGDTETIEIYSIIDGEFYKDGLRQEESNGKYTYRNGQKLYAGFTLENIDIVRSYVLENQLNATIYLRKTDKDKITILLENIIEDHWFTSSNLGLYDENPSTWLYRKKILIDHTKVDGNLTNFPVLIYLNDFDLNLYAKSDGSDIIFTSKDGKTKLKREIESYSPRESYEYRKKITIDKDKVDGDLTDFPVLISLEDENLMTYAKTDGSDIFFTLSDGETRLKREIEDYNSETGTLIAWVKVPSLSSTTNTEIYMYFGNSDENNTNDKDVWDSNYVGVWHKNDLTTSTIKDSTSNNNTGTKISANNPIETTGKIGKAQLYFNDSNYISIVENSSVLVRDNFTVSAWIKYSNTSASNRYFIDRWDASNNKRVWGYLARANQNFVSVIVSSSGSNSEYAEGTTTVNDNSYHHITFIRNGQNIYHYVDGNLSVQRTTAITSLYDTNTLLSFGKSFAGIIDEIKFSKTARSPAWIKTEYNNQSSPETFSAVGELETITTSHSELFAWVKIPELSTEEDTAIYMYFGNPDANESNDKDVWDEDYAVVLHFNNSLLDSTINNINGITTGTITPVKDRFNNLNAFSFASGYVTIPKPFNQNNLEQIWTVDAWYKLKTNNSTQTLLHRGSFNAGCHFIWGATKNPLLYLNVGDHDYYTYGNGNYIKTNVWQKITYVFRNSDTYRKIYVNGTDITTSGPNKTSTPAGITSTINIGDPYTGDLDAVRISKIARSEEWIKTEYNNQSVPAEFVKVGILEKA